MMRMAPVSGLVALLETSAMFGLGVAAAQLLGWSPRERLFAGALVAISSTTIIGRAFRERPVEPAVRDTVFGILVFEDLIAILLIAALTTLGGGDAPSARAMGGTVLQLVTFLAALIGIGLPRGAARHPRHRAPAQRRNHARRHRGARLRRGAPRPDLRLLGRAWRLRSGALVAESGARRTIEPLLAPLRDLFAAVFFVAVGMSIDPTLVALHWGRSS